VKIIELTTTAQHDAVAELFQRIWRAESPDQLINAGMLQAFAHSGNYVVGAYEGDDLVGGAVAFLGAGHLHSHITGVVPGGQGHGIGYALKQHQRLWCLDRGIPEVRWTYDPLVRRNAYFNLQKLGARPTRYLPDFYGRMTDGVNAGDVSDRLYVTWRLDAPHVVAAANGEHPEPTVDGAVVMLDRDGEAPVTTGRTPGPRCLVALPLDIEALRPADPRLTARWRLAVRAALTTSLSSGYAITGATRDGYYLVERA